MSNIENYIKNNINEKLSVYYVEELNDDRLIEYYKQITKATYYKTRELIAIIIYNTIIINLGLDFYSNKQYINLIAATILTGSGILTGIEKIIKLNNLTENNEIVENELVKRELTL